MDMLNKLKSTVGGLIGNPVTREYEITRHVGSGGPGCLWKIYQGVKRSTKQEAGIFVFEKKLLERFSRKDRDAILETLKKGATQMTRLRHPCVLTVQHPMEESRESLAFATEPVFTSLANILGCHDNMPSTVPPDIGDHKLFEVEIKYGFLQLTDALKFLHNDVHMIHGNLCPSSIVLNGNGAWKLAGFDFVIPSSTPPDQPASFPARELLNDVSAVLQPTLDYLAPEYQLTQSCDTASDMFSVGMLMYSVLNKGKALNESNENLSTFKRNSEQLKHLNINTLRSLPNGLKEYIKMLLSTTPTIRPDADQLGKIPFFDDVGAMTLQYVDSLFQQDNQQKAQFFKGLPKVLSQLPKRVVQQRVLPCLNKEFMNPDMVPFVLPNVLHIAEQCSDQEYVKLVLPSLKGVFKMQEPVQILLIFMQRMNLLLSKTPSDDIKNHVLPMVYRALETPSTQVQELCLSILPTFAGMIEYTSIKHSIIPRMKKLCLETALLSIRVGCLVCIGKMLEHMDKWFVLDEIFPLLEQIPSREPAVLMGMLGIIKVSISHKKLGITKDIAATKVLPFLFPLCIDNNLNLNQFNAFMGVISELIKTVEKEQRIKLEQLHTLQEEQKTSVEFAQKLQSNGTTKDSPSSGGDSLSQGGTGVDQMFGSLGLDGERDKRRPSANQGSSSSSTSKLGGASSSKQPDPTPVRPAQVSLSLEEKQRLQKDQEFQQRLKTQKPIQASETAKQAPKSQSKDLTTSLMDSTPKLQRPVTGAGMDSTAGSRNGGGAFMSSGIGSNTSSAYAAPSMTNSSGAASYGDKSSAFGVSNASLLSQPMRMQGPAQTGQSQPKKNMDMSAFDSLLGPSQSQQSRKSLNQMSSTGAPQAPTAQRQGGAFGNMGQASFGGVGQSAYGQQSQASFAPMQQGMMGGQGAQQMGQGSWAGSSMPSQQTQQSMGQKQGGAKGMDLDPFTPKAAAGAGQNQQKGGGGNLLDFLG